MTQKNIVNIRMFLHPKSYYADLIEYRLYVPGACAPNDYREAILSRIRMRAIYGATFRGLNITGLSKQKTYTDSRTDFNKYVLRPMFSFRPVTAMPLHTTKKYAQYKV